MKIDSGLSGYGYAHRSYNTERVVEEVQANEAETRQRSAFALTGSSTFLSNSLASALWAVEGSDNGTIPGDAAPSSATAASMEWVEGAYQEFSDYH